MVNRKIAISGFARTRFSAILLSATLGGCGLLGDFSRTDTIALPGTGVTIYAAGDIADCRTQGAANTAALITAGLAADQHAAVLTLGDNTYPEGRPQEFSECYEKTWGQFKSRTYPSPGNHDYYTPGAAGYFGYFAAAAGPGTLGYYSYDLGKWHLVSLNSNLAPAEYQAQLAWLKSDLAQHPHACSLAYWHHPMYSSGGHGNTERMKEVWQALDSAGVDVVLVAHDHDYERFAPISGGGERDDLRGMRQFVVGTGGAGLTAFGLTSKHSKVLDNSTHGVLRMTLKDIGYEWKFLPVEGGSFTDHGVALCH